MVESLCQRNILVFLLSKALNFVESGCGKCQQKDCATCNSPLVTVRNEVAKVMFLHVSVILFGGVLSQNPLQVVSQHALQQVLWGVPVPGGSALAVPARGGGACSWVGGWSQGNPGGDPPTENRRLLLQTVCILLECILVISRNEVLAKVIFSQGGGWVSQHALQVSPGGCLVLGGCLQFWGGVSNFFWEGSLIFLGGVVSDFLGGLQLFLGGRVWLRGGGWGEVKGGPPNFFFEFFFYFCFLWGYTPPGTRHRNTVNVRPVRILLECILVYLLNLPVFNWISEWYTDD